MNKWAWLWGFIPVYVRYVDFIETRVMRDGAIGTVEGRSHWFWADILKTSSGNIGLLAHELEHCKQAWMLPFGAYSALRKVNKRYRAWCEACAYAAQTLAFGPMDEYREARIDAYAYLIANAYGLTITQAAARELILEEIRG